MKKEYIAPKAEVKKIESKDVITSSTLLKATVMHWFNKNDITVNKGV